MTSSDIALHISITMITLTGKKFDAGVKKKNKTNINQYRHTHNMPEWINLLIPRHSKQRFPGL
jgi:phosphotransferase system IIA component